MPRNPNTSPYPTHRPQCQGQGQLPQTPCGLSFHGCSETWGRITGPAPTAGGWGEPRHLSPSPTSSDISSSAQGAAAGRTWGTSGGNSRHLEGIKQRHTIWKEVLVGGRVLSALVRRQAVPRGPQRGQGAVGPDEEAVQLGLQVVPHLAHLQGKGTGSARQVPSRTQPFMPHPETARPVAEAGGDMPPPALGHLPQSCPSHSLRRGPLLRRESPKPEVTDGRSLCPLHTGAKRHKSARHRGLSSTVSLPALSLPALPASPAGSAGQTPGPPPPGDHGE